MNSLEKWMILTPLQKLTNNAGDLGKIIVATCFEWLPKVQKIAQSGHTACQTPNCMRMNYLVTEIFWNLGAQFKKISERGTL